MSRFALLTAICIGSCVPAPAFAQHPSLVRMNEGEPAPFAGRLVLESAWVQITQEMAAADEVIPRLEADLVRCRQERKTTGTTAVVTLGKGADKAEGVERDIAAVPMPDEAPSRVSWAGLGAGVAVVLGLVGYVATESAGGRLQDASALGGVLVGGGLAVGWAWVLE